MNKQITAAVILALFLCLLPTTAYCRDAAKKPWTIQSRPPSQKGKWAAAANFWQERRDGKVLLNYYFIPISRGHLDFRLDHLDLPQSNSNFQRLRLHYGNFYLSKSKDFVFLFKPGGMLDTRGRVFYGGKVTWKFPKAGITLTQKSYGGNKIDYHQTFADAKLIKGLHVLYYRYANSRAIPTATIGPKVIIAKRFYAYYGFPTNKDDRQIIWAGGSFRF